MSREGPHEVSPPVPNGEDLNVDNATEANAEPRIAVEAGVEEDLNGPEISFRTAELLDESNRNIFQKMSEGGKDLANQAYEGLYKVPVVNRLVGKMEIAYNQFWVDRHEDKAIKFKEKADGLDIKLNTFDQSTKEIESAIGDLKRQNIPGVESLQAKLRDVENQKRDLLDKKDRIQSKFEARDNKTKLYTNERDMVADKLIGYYNEKMAPMEKELGNLETCRDKVDLIVAVTEARHREQRGRLAGIENRKGQIEEALRGIGMSEKEIKKFEAVKALDKVLSQGRENMRKEMDNLARRKAEINKTVAKVDKKANPYRDRREEFIRVKQGRPVEVNMAARQRGVDNTSGEKAKGHTRAEGRETSPTRFEEVPGPIEEETSQEEVENFEVSKHINGWNVILEDKYGKEASKEMVDIKDFIKATGLPEGYKLDSNEFMKILGRYYKFRKMPTGKLNAEAKNFLDMVEKLVEELRKRNKKE